MLSTALYVAWRRYGRRFRLARRTRYAELLAIHPAVECVGNPPSGATVVTNSYWNCPEYAAPGARALQVVKHMFGVGDDDSECLYLPPYEKDGATEIIMGMLPPHSRMIVISISSESPRKTMDASRWQTVVDGLRADGILIVQTGNAWDTPLQNCYNLLGVTTPLQLLHLAAKADLALCHDSFLMHAAKACDTPAIALFGPTPSSVYGYGGNVNMQADPSACPFADTCISSHSRFDYSDQCPHDGSDRCMDAHSPAAIIAAARRLLSE